MSEESSQEKTELPTERRLSKARKDGDVARSKELAMASIMILTASLMLFIGGDVVSSLGNMLSHGLTLDRSQVFDTKYMTVQFLSLLGDGLLAILPIMIIGFVVALLTPAFMGGWVFSTKTIAPKLSRLSLMKGFKRMFGIKALVELIKAIAKFLLVFGVGLFVLNWYSDSFLLLARSGMETAFAQAGEIFVWSVFYMCLTLVFIAAIDVPFQAFQHIKKLKMTLQEVKDELKDIEGRPEVKAAIRQKQREISMQRMLDSVPDADVVIVNPEHYAVALGYDRESDGAPVVLAKGIDHMSQRIRDAARENSIEVIRLPVLARAIYYTTDLNDEIPEPLYLAVAQVLSYVFSVNDEAYGDQDIQLPDIEVPGEFHFDSTGRPAKG